MDLRTRLPLPARAVCDALGRGLRGERAAASAPAHGEEVLAALGRTGLAGAYHRAVEAGAARARPGVAEAARAAYYGTLGANMLRFDTFARLAVALGEAGVAVAPLKGLVWAAWVHGDPGVRPMADADVLVAASDIEAADRVLASLGYRRAPMPLDAFAGPWGRHVPAYLHPTRGVAVEVHRSVDYGFGFLGGPPDVLGRSRPADWDGRPVRAPCWEDVLYQWAVHTVYMDGWTGKLRDLYDLAALLERLRPALDWDRVFARGFYTARPLWLGLDAAASVFGSPACRRAAAVAARRVQGFPTRGPALRWRDAVLARGRAAPGLPLSVVSAFSFGLHNPEHLPRFLGAFLRVFLFPPRALLTRQYPALARRLPRPLLRLVRPLHVAGVLVHRLLRRGRSPS